MRGSISGVDAFMNMGGFKTSPKSMKHGSSIITGSTTVMSSTQSHSLATTRLNANVTSLRNILLK